MQNGHMELCKTKPQKCPLVSLGCQFEGPIHEHANHLTTELGNHSKKIVQAITDQTQTQAALQNRFADMQTYLTELQALTDEFRSENSTVCNQMEPIQKSIDKLTIDVNTLIQTIVTRATNIDLQKCVTQVKTIGNITSSHERRIKQIEDNGTTGTSGNRDNTGSTAILDEKLGRIERTIGLHDVRIAESDLRFRLLETAAFNGKLIWRIPNYSRRKQDAIDGRTVSLYSQPFYTSYFGYKMCARVYLNGDGLGKNSHLSLFFVLMRGEYDPLQQWPFRQRVTLSILDQSGNRKHITDTFRPDPTSTSFRRPVGEMNIASGSPMFAMHSKVESAPYLKDDTVFICITVDCTDLVEPWV